MNGLLCEDEISQSVSTFAIEYFEVFVYEVKVELLSVLSSIILILLFCQEVPGKKMQRVTNNNNVVQQAVHPVV